MRFIVRRLVSGLLLLFLVSLLVFALAEAAPGDVLSELELNPLVSEETVEALRQRYGLDRGVVERYGAWLRSVATGELGYSLAYKMPVGDLLFPRVRNTLLLTVLSTAVVWAVALVLGTWMAWKEGGVIDRLGLGLDAVLLALPQLLLALGALFLAAASGLFPLGGMTSLGFEELGFFGRLGDLARHLALPMTVLILSSLPVLLRHVRSAILEVLDAPFLHAARGHGITPRRLVARYALPAAANPLISLFGFTVAGLLSGALVVEVVLSWPGMGPLLIEAILARDVHVAMAATLLSAALVVAGQLLADVWLGVADPRIREVP